MSNKTISEVLICGLLLTVGTILSALAIRQSVVNAQTAGTPDSPRPEVRFTPGPTRIVERDEPEWRQSIRLQAMVSQSRVIAVGEAVKNKARWTQNGQDIATDYDIRLTEIIKGNVEVDSIISVTMPGGLMMERDGSILNVMTRGINRMQNGKRYVLFLKNASGRGTLLTPLNGSQGLYEIRNNGSRVFHLGRSFDSPPTDDGEELSLFLQSLRNIGKP